MEADKQVIGAFDAFLDVNGFVKEQKEKSGLLTESHMESLLGKLHDLNQVNIDAVLGQ